MSLSEKRSAQQNLLLRWFDEVWNQRRTETIDELLPPDCIIHEGNTDIDPLAFKQFHRDMCASFPELKMQVLQTITQDDLSCVRWISSLRDHRGKSADVAGMTIVRFEDGRVREAWQVWDRQGLEQQLSA